MFALTVLLGGCNSQDALSRFASPEDQANARYEVELLQQRRFDELTKYVDPKLQGPELPAMLEKMAAHFPVGQPTSVKLIGGYVLSIGGGTKRTLTFEYEFSGHWLLADLTTVTSGEGTRIVAFHIQPLAGSLENQNRFTLHGKGAPQYSMLLMAVLDIVFCIVAFIVCLRTPMLRNKWLWAILCFVSAFRVNVNWTTGQFTFNPFFLNIPPAGFGSQMYGPCILYAGIPLGAIVFLVVRSRKPDSAPITTAPLPSLSELSAS
jgi:hypothetical protein